MLDKKRRLFRLIEIYVNDFQKEPVQEIYGDGSKIKIHNINFSSVSKSLIIEGVIVLGNTINENSIDKRDFSLYFNRPKPKIFI